eukprot:290698-Hanusia_phi.AAC.1
MSQHSGVVMRIIFDDGKDFKFKTEKVSVGRIASNDVHIPGDLRISKQHCVLWTTVQPGGECPPLSSGGSSARSTKRQRLAAQDARDDGGERVIWIQDTSTNGTIVNGSVLQNDKRRVEANSVIELAPRNPSCTFRISIQNSQEIEEAKEREEQEETQRVDYYEIDAAPAPDQHQDNMIQSLSCVICTEIFFFPVALLPCMHKFCGACIFRNRWRWRRLSAIGNAESRWRHS